MAKIGEIRLFLLGIGGIGGISSEKDRMVSFPCINNLMCQEEKRRNRHPNVVAESFSDCWKRAICSHCSKYQVRHCHKQPSSA